MTYVKVNLESEELPLCCSDPKGKSQGGGWFPAIVSGVVMVHQFYTTVTTSNTQYFFVPETLKGLVQVKYRLY